MMFFSDVDQLLSLFLKLFLLIEIVIKVSNTLAPYAAYLWNGARDRFMMLWDPRAFARNIAYQVYREENFAHEVRRVARRAPRQLIANE